MLEVRNLSKIYTSKQKNGTDTHALDGVTLSFPEKGMVFLLGKSGSGKSTLLNVCGGLDAPTDGEIIVKGRSSKSFSQSDFDSYRNTFIGFIFQEYNILNEFSVEDNIALALELQGKPKDKKAIAELLEQVDLTGFAKRKPNTLSGGQKQRIAIARALVKSPEIIMADEPTGALDSATGKQVFDTLKKLSQDKLVIVVSHDREFAEFYADRIIELKDGKILSDVTKTQEKQEMISGNVTAIGDVLCIKQGSNLTDEEFDRIKSIIKRKSGDVIIAGGEQDVKNFKKANRITEDGEKEVFKDTDESRMEKKTYTPEQSRFIRSKLPARHAAKIGVSGLKTKPVRLFFTILLCVVSFVLFGVLSTLMLYNSEGMFKQTLKDSRHDFVVFDKIYLTRNAYYENGELSHSYESYSDAKFGSAEFEQISQIFGEGSFGAVTVNTQIALRQATSMYWNNILTSAAYLPENAFLRQGLMGQYPQAKNEICVSTYVADMIVECKTTDKNGATVTLSSREDLIGKTILIDGNEFKVTGIFDSGEIDAKFGALKDSANEDYSLMRDFESLLSDGTHLLVAVSEEGLVWFNERFGIAYDPYFEADSNQRGSAHAVDPNAENDENENSNDFSFNTNVIYKAFSGVSHSQYIGLINGKTTLESNEAIVSYNLLYSIIWNRIEAERNDMNEILNILGEMDFKARDIDNSISNLQNQLSSINSEIERIENEMAMLDPDSPDYQFIYDSYVMDKENRIEEKNTCESRIQDYENEKAQLFRDSVNGIEVTPETLSQLIEAYRAECDKLDALNSTIEIIQSGRIWNVSVDENLKDEDAGYRDLTVEERTALLNGLIREYPEFVNGLTLEFAISSPMTQMLLTEVKEYSIVGIVIPTGNLDYYVENQVYLNDAVVDEYWSIQKMGTSYHEVSSIYQDEPGAI
ncbi:MAG: ABC transporter ATP-binding protein, partial [Clostridia bacterium]|nr:ABC transporter ATP-binding protein [Clostridia bacterium]